MSFYKLTGGGSHTRFEDGVPIRYSKGDEIELADSEVEAFRKRVALVPVSTGNEATTAAVKVELEPEAAETATGPRDFSGLANEHWKVAQKIISGIDSIEDARAALEAERTGKARTPVLTAAEEKVTELGG